MWERERRSENFGGERYENSAAQLMDIIRTEYGLSRRERDHLERAVSMELSQPDRQKWFRGSNNRIFRVVGALAKQRGTKFPKSLPDRLSLYVRDAANECMESKPPQVAHPRRGGPYLVTPAMRVSMGLPPVVTCDLDAGHKGAHSWEMRPQDQAIYANWAGLFPNTLGKAATEGYAARKVFRKG